MDIKELMLTNTATEHYKEMNFILNTLTNQHYWDTDEYSELKLGVRSLLNVIYNGNRHKEIVVVRYNADNIKQLNQCCIGMYINTWSNSTLDFDDYFNNKAPTALLRLD